MIATRAKLRVDAKHPRVTEELREKIVAGEYALGAQLPHRDVLEIELGASRATVQVALNSLLREGFLTSISGKGTFVAERPPFTTDYGALFSLPADMIERHGLFYAAIRVAAGELLQSRTCRLRSYYQSGSNSNDDFAAAASDSNAHRIAGMILVGVPYDLAQTSLLTHPPGLPRVAIQEGLSPTFRGPSVYPNLMGFYRRAFERCLLAGRRRVAVICADRRVDVIRDMAEAMGLACPAGHVIAIPCDWSWTCRSLVSLLFSLPRDDRPDALVIGDDNLVNDATAGLLSIGLKFPGELSVVAHANLPMLPRSHVPCEFVAFDARQTVDACIQSIDAQRRGQSFAEMTLIDPVLVPLASPDSRFAG